MFPNKKWTASPINEFAFIQFLTKHKAAISLIVLFIIASLTNEYFLTWGNQMNLIRQATVVGIIALGVQFVMLLGMIDFSVGSVLAFSGTVIMVMQSTYHIGIIPSVILGVFTGCLLGLINGLLVSIGQVPSFITTLGMMFIFRSITMWYASGGAVYGVKANYTILGHGYTFGIPNLIYPFIIAIIAAHIVLKRTLLGRYIYAIGQNRVAALMTGVPIRAVTITAFIISGCAAGIGAVFETSRLNSISTGSSGISYELDVISAIVIGGTNPKGGQGVILGTVCGTLILTIIGNYMNLQNISPYFQGILKGLLILIILYRQNQRD